MRNLVNNLIGFMMRLYRHSPIYPKAGKMLAKWLAVFINPKSKSSIVRDINGINYELDLNQVIDASLFYSGVYEEDAEKIINKYTTAGMVVIDIGANFGYHTFRMSKNVGDQGQVIAIEPTSWAYQKLLRNGELNNSQNVKYLKLGLSDQDEGMVNISFQSSYPLDGNPEQTVESVSIQKLDTVVEQNKLDRVDFIKMDVDGFEGKIIKGAKLTLDKFHPTILFEFSPNEIIKLGDDPAEILNHFISRGYKFFTDSEKEIMNISEYSKKIQDGVVSNIMLAVILE